VAGAACARATSTWERMGCRPGSCRFGSPNPKMFPAIFSAPRAGEPGIAAWVALVTGLAAPHVARDARERLGALGYLR
jgi:hypothetical protein